MLTDNQKKGILKVLSEIETKLTISSGEFEAIGKVLNLNEDELEKEIIETIIENEGGFSFSRSSKPNFIDVPILNQVCVAIDEFADKKYKHFCIVEDV